MQVCKCLWCHLTVHGIHPSAKTQHTDPSSQSPVRTFRVSCITRGESDANASDKDLTLKTSATRLLNILSKLNADYFCPFRRNVLKMYATCPSTIQLNAERELMSVNPSADIHTAFGRRSASCISFSTEQVHLLSESALDRAAKASRCIQGHTPKMQRSFYSACDKRPLLP